MNREIIAQTMCLTKHARQRAAQRNLATQDLRYVVRHGRRFHKAGALIFFLRSGDLPAADRAEDNYRRLVGTAVVLSPDGQRVLTTWRNRQNGLRQIKRKVAYSMEVELPWRG